MSGRSKLPSPALVISCVSLIVALSSTAVAAGIVANARHANKADLATRALNSDKLQGRTAVQIAVAGAQAGAQLPGPASSAAGLVTVKAAMWSLAPGAEGDVTVPCDSGQKAISGGWDDPGGWGKSVDSRPTPDGSAWRTYVTVGSGAPGPQSGTVYAICLE
jgi:hypothetical protein